MKRGSSTEIAQGGAGTRARNQPEFPELFRNRSRRTQTVLNSGREPFKLQELEQLADDNCRVLRARTSRGSATLVPPNRFRHSSRDSWCIMTETNRLPLAKLHGIIPPLATPLLDRDTLDVDGTERLVEHVLAGGVHGLFVLGTTGEGPSLSHDLQHKFVELVCEQVGGRVPVLVGVTDPSLRESVELAQGAEAAGAAAIVAAAPYYFAISQSELLYHMRQLAHESPLPLVLYNMPSCVKVSFEPDTVRACLEMDEIIGLKDSSGNLDYFRQVRAIADQRAGFALLIGPEEKLAVAMGLGADGGVSGGANLEPQTYVGLYEAAVRGDDAEVARLHERILAISATIYRAEPQNSRIIKGLKCSLGTLGLCSDFVMPPFEPVSETLRETIREHVQTLQLQPARSL